MKKLRTLLFIGLFTIPITTTIAQSNNFIEFKVGSLLIDWNPASGIGYGGQFGFGHNLNKRFTIVGNLTLSQASTFPSNVGVSEDRYFNNELGAFTTDSGFRLPNRLHEHIMSLSPFEALQTNYHTSNYSSVGIGFRFTLIKRERLEMSIGLLGIRQWADEFSFNIYQVWYTNSVLTDYAYDVSLYQLQSWGYQIQNTITWNVSDKIALTSNIDWSSFKPIEVGAPTNVLTFFSLGTRISFE